MAKRKSIYTPPDARSGDSTRFVIAEDHFRSTQTIGRTTTNCPKRERFIDSLLKRRGKQ